MATATAEITKPKTGVKKPKAARSRSAKPKAKKVVTQPVQVAVVRPMDSDPIQEGYAFALAVIKEREEEIVALREQIATAEADIRFRKAQAAALKPFVKKS